jgi:hypothetical protein
MLEWVLGNEIRGKCNNRCLVFDVSTRGRVEMEGWNNGRMESWLFS